MSKFRWNHPLNKEEETAGSLADVYSKGQIDAKLSDNADYLKGKNLFYLQVKNKRYKDGIEESSTTLGYCKIPVESGKTYTISGQINWSSAKNETFLDANGVSIEGGFSCRENGSGGTSQPYTVTVPSNAKYLIVTCCYADSTYNDYDKIQVEVGETATSYIPYAMSNVDITKELSNLIKHEDATLTFNGGASAYNFDIDHRIILDIREIGANGSLEMGFYRRNSTSIGVTAFSYGSTGFSGSASFRILYMDL